MLIDENAITAESNHMPGRRVFFVGCGWKTQRVQFPLDRRHCKCLRTAGSDLAVCAAERALRAVRRTDREGADRRHRTACDLFGRITWLTRYLSISDGVKRLRLDWKTVGAATASAVVSERERKFLKEADSKLLDKRGASWCRHYLDEWLDAAKHSRLRPLGQFALMIEMHLGIRGSRDVRLSFGVVEGLCNKVTAVRHRSYGSLLVWQRP